MKHGSRSEFDQTIEGKQPHSNDGMGGEIGRSSGYTCPNCHGAIWEQWSDSLVIFRCRVGHAYSSESMLAGQLDMVEERLWSAIVALEENASLAYRMLHWARKSKNAGMAKRLQGMIRKSERQSKTIKKLVMEPNP